MKCTSQLMGIRANISQLLRRRDLLFVLVKKRLKEKHVGSLLGYFWSFYTALLPLFTYILVFFFIAKIRVEGTDGPWGYFLFVFSGLLPWLFFNRIVVESVDALNSNLDILKQAIFPVEIICIVSATENLVNLVMQSALLLIIILFSTGVITWKLVLLPLYITVLYMLCLGLAWMLSILGFFVRDFKDILTSLLGFLIYFTPIMYAKSNIPEKLWPVFILNPMTHAINVFRDIVYFPTVQSPMSWFVFGGISFVGFFLGYLSILSVRKSIGDMV